MGEIKTISSADVTQNALSATDLELEFRRIIRYGTKTQVNEIPQTKTCCAMSFMYYL